MGDSSQFPLVAGVIVLVVALALVLIASRGSIFALFGKPRALERKTLDVERKTRELNSAREALARRRAVGSGLSALQVVMIGAIAAILCGGDFLVAKNTLFTNSNTTLMQLESSSAEDLSQGAAGSAAAPSPSGN